MSRSSQSLVLFLTLSWLVGVTNVAQADQITGRIIQVGAFLDGMSGIVVRGDDGQNYVLNLVANTNARVNGSQVMPVNLRAGDRVMVLYDYNGTTLIAKDIWADR